MTTPDDAKLVEDLRAIGDGFEQRSSVVTARAEEAAATIERLRAELADAKLRAHNWRDKAVQCETDACELVSVREAFRARAVAAESALSTARSTAFREAAEELHRFANNYPLHNTRRDAFRLLAERFDAKAKEDTQP